MGFVKDYIETGNGSLAAKNNYDVANDNTARAIASENLTNPNIVKAIDEALNDAYLAKKHMQLLEASALERLSFNNRTTDETIEEVVAKMPGYELLTIVRKEDANTGSYTDVYAYVRAPDNTTQEKALDKAYKIKGSYAPEKKANLNVNVDATEERTDAELEAIRQRFLLEIKTKIANGQPE